jgi:DNA-binding CsgD family transcriptional regulator
LPHRDINDFLETKNGDLLVASTGGFAVFNSSGTAYHWNIVTSRLEQNSTEPPIFHTFFTSNPDDEPKKRGILTLAQSQSGKNFAGTGMSLFELEKSGDEWIFHRLESELFSEDTVFAALQFDSADYLWMLTSSGIYRMSPQGVESLKEAVAGGSPISPEVAHRVITIFREIRPPECADYDLTQHETRLLKMLVEDHNYKTAAEIGVTVHAVSLHMCRIYEKLQVHIKPKAVAVALRDCLIK